MESVMRQELLWMPQGEKPRGSVPFTEPRPTRVWTLFEHKDESVRPPLPYTPVHTETAFLEDHVHDWVIWRGHFQYFSRITDLTRSGVWLLLEWREESKS